MTCQSWCVPSTPLGNTYQAAGRPDRARDTWQQAIAVLDGIQHPDTQRLRANLGVRPAELAFTLVQTCW